MDEKTTLKKVYTIGGREFSVKADELHNIYIKRELFSGSKPHVPSSVSLDRREGIELYKFLKHVFGE
jgi:hypothetical protein